MTDETRSATTRTLRRYAPVIAIVAVIAAVVVFLPEGDDDVASTPTTAAESELVGARGTTVNGTECGPDVRQVEWSKYSALCVPVFEGDNGGDTAPGVTAETITVAARTSTSGTAAAIAAASPSLNAEAQQAYQHDLGVYVDYFNTQFELYGRQVELHTFDGQGDWVAENQGQNLPGAQADAATERSVGAFADLSNGNVASTPAFAQALAENQVISAGGVGGSQTFFETYAPYIYSTTSTVTDSGEWLSGLTCQRLAGLPAVFAGDEALHDTERVFGLLYPTNPDFQLVGSQIEEALAGCDAAPAKVFQYALSLGSLATDSTNAIAQFRDAGVTTILCACDNVSPRFFTGAADAQSYSPEWVGITASATLARNFSPTQWGHALATSNGTIAPDDTEAHQVYLEASGGQEPAGEAYPLAYAAALLFFNSVQNAGPELTPETYQQGFASLPDSLPDGDMGPWAFDELSFTPSAGIGVAWFDATAPNPVDAKDGTYVSCEGVDGAPRPWTPASGYGKKGTQLACFGRSAG